MPFDGLIWVGQRSRSHGLDELSLDNLLVLKSETISEVDLISCLKMLEQG